MKKNADFNKSITDNWSTPKELYDLFMKNGFIDPCPLNSKFNGLETNYTNKRLFINPPFSDLSTWVDYAIKQMLNNCFVVLLMPSRTDTKYFHRLLKYNPIIVFFEGRLKFGNSNKCAPFPTMLVYMDHNYCDGLRLYGSININNIDNLCIK